MRIGYARVSKNDDKQKLDLQMDALTEAGCEKIFSDNISGAKEARPGLDQCMDILRKGDTLIVWRLDRLGRSLPHLVDVVSGLQKRKVGFKSLQDGVIDTTSASGELIFHIFAAMAQFERNLIRERTNAGLKAARARGRVGGRKKLAPDNAKIKTAKALSKDPDMKIADICKTLKISRTTYYRWINCGTA